MRWRALAIPEDAAAGGARPEFVHPAAPFAHPFDDGTAVVVERSIDETAASLGGADARVSAADRAFAARAGDLMEALLGPPGRGIHC